MTFLELLIKIFPLYLIAGLGIVAGRLIPHCRGVISALLIYIIAPVVVLYGVWKTPLTAEVLALPITFFLIGSTLAVLVYNLARYKWNDTTRNILAFTAGTGNTGYFGLPLVIAVLGPDAIAIAVLSTLGITIYESTVGVYFVARGNFSAAQSLGKILRLPIFHAVIAGILIKQIIPAPEPWTVDLFQKFVGTYSVLGMMLVGIGLSGVRLINLDWAFIGSALVIKFIFWPVTILSILLIDTQYLHIFTAEQTTVMLLLAVVPLAALTVAYAAALDAQPEKAALAVLISTLVALISIPLGVPFLQSLLQH